MLYRYPLLFFFLLSYAISWSIWSPLLLAKQGIISYQPPQYLHLLGSLGPALAALIITRVCSGSVGLRDLWRRMFQWRVALRWYAILQRRGFCSGRGYANANANALFPFFLFFIAVLFTGWNSWEPQSFGRSAEITVWGIAVLFIARPKYLSATGKVVMGQKEEAYKVVVQKS
jgi:hypothetical protein